MTTANATDEVRRYFARPQYGGTLTWPTVVSTMVTTDVCTNYIASDEVGYRLKGHHHLRGTLVVTITTVTSPHHVGRVQFTLAPVAFTQLSNNMTNAYSIFASDNSLVVDASTANPITLRLPFSCPTDWLNFRTTEDRLGILYMSCLCPLKRDDGGTVGTPKLTYFVSIEDIELGALTPYETSADMEDKIIAGPISGVADKFKAAGDVLSDVPVIGWLASTVSSVASTVGSVARIFGFSRPTQPVKINYISVHKPAGDLTHANVIDESTKLSLYTDAAYPISGEGLGTHVDSLSWSNIIGRWGLIDIETWAYTSPAGTRIAYYAVTPDLCKKPSDDWWFPTPLSYLSPHFQTWCGSINFRLTVAASPYIKGQLLVVYTPNASTPTALSISDYMASSQYCILNLNQELDKVVEIGWSSNMKYLVCGDYLQKNTASPRANGYLQIIVLEPLVSSAPVDLSIVVSMCAGGDFMYMLPTDVGVNDFVISGRVVEGPSEQDHQAQESYQAAMQAQRDKPSKPKGDKDTIRDRKPEEDFQVSADMEQPYKLRDPNAPALVSCHFGNKSNDAAFVAFNNSDYPRSARAWLRRYAHTFTWTNKFGYGTGSDDTLVVDLQFPHVPGVQIGQVAYQSSRNGGIANPTYRPFTPLSAILTMFVGYTGAIRHKVVARIVGSGTTSVGPKRYALDMALAQALVPAYDETYIHDTSTTVIVPGFNSWPATAVDTLSKIDIHANKLKYAATGIEYLHSEDGTVVGSVELPFVSPFRYGFQTSTVYGETAGLMIRLATRRPATDANGGPSNVNCFTVTDYLSIGEDFNVFFFFLTPAVRTNISPASFSYANYDFNVV